MSTATVTKKKESTSGNETVSLTQENLYNGEGQRIQKKEAGEVTNYFYEDGMVSYTTGADTGEKLIQNLSGLEDNVIYAEQKVTGTDGTASDYQDFLYTKDIQGSTSSILNKDTKGELSYEYDDFGETSIHGNSALKNEICYTGGIYDESTGLYYLNARYYDPENGRFLTEDTYWGEVNDPDTLHLYVYCKNNPINYVDPSGHKYYATKDKKPKKQKAPFKYIGGKTRKISWVKGTVASKVSSVIAKKLPQVDRIIVAIKIGLDVLSEVASACAGGTLKYKWYSRKVGQYMNYKTVWSVKFNNGLKTGTIISYSNV